MRISIGVLLFLAACSKPRADAVKADKPDVAAPLPMPSHASACRVTGEPRCLRFDTPEDAFRFVLEPNPAILAVGEAHAPKGGEAIASSTKRFTDAFLPLLAPRSSDVVVELWAPDPKCQKEVKQVASAQKPITEAQAAENQNEYVTLGTRAKELGMTPWLLRPTCTDFSNLADAGADSVDAMLKLVKRLTQEKLVQLDERSHRDAAAPKMLVTYGGALHNDLHPAAESADYSFGPELDRRTEHHYVELDLIVPEFVRDTAIWQKLPWYAAWKSEAQARPKDKATIFVLAERSYVLVLPSSS